MKSASAGGDNDLYEIHTEKFDKSLSQSHTRQSGDPPPVKRRNTKKVDQATFQQDRTEQKTHSTAEQRHPRETSATQKKYRKEWGA